MSFKGTNVGIRRLTISGSNLEVEILFQDDDGVVHATMAHQAPLESLSPEIRKALGTFRDEVLAWVKPQHFSNIDPGTPGAQDTRKTLHGIAEALTSGHGPTDGLEEAGR